MSTQTESEGVSSFTLTSVEPLTTIFTPNEDCTRQNAYDTSYIGNFVIYDLDSSAYEESCYPSSYSENQFDSRNWYSPGVCPYSYEYVDTSVLSHDDAPATTFATCCPPGISRINIDGWSCSMEVASGTRTISETYIVNSTRYWGNPISVAWQESDLSLFSPESAPLLALHSAGFSVSLEVTTESSTTSESASPESKTSGRVQETSSGSGDTGGGGGGGLSSGAAAGIGVGAAIGGMMIMGAIWWFRKRYKILRKDKNIGEGGQTWVQQVYKAPDITTQPHVVAEVQRNEVQS